MNKIYIIAGLIFTITGAYWTGGRVASEKCYAEQAEKQNTDMLKIINLRGKINAETYNTATADIRGLLCDKYTIKD